MIKGEKHLFTADTQWFVSHRNVMVEAARIARGEIESLDKLTADGFDAVIFPGGFGAAKNL